MHPAILLSTISVLAVTGAVAQGNATSTVTSAPSDATVTTNNPAKAVYLANLPATEFFNPSDPHGNIKGLVSASAGPGGVGVAFDVNFSNLPTSGGPFREQYTSDDKSFANSLVYHIHDMPVNSTGNCLSTLGHLDPFNHGETPACNSNAPQSCQVGDLSGKHGKITSNLFTVGYVDNYASLVPGDGSFIGNRSIVIHFANTTRITCANFYKAATVLPPPSPNATVTATATPSVFTGSAAGITASFTSVFAALTAALLL